MFTPQIIIKQRQRRLIATILLMSLFFSTTYYLFTSKPVTATTTTTWDDEVTLDRATQTDTTKDDFLAGYSLPPEPESPNPDAATVVSDENGGEVILSTQPYVESGMLHNGNVFHTFSNDSYLYVSTDSGLYVIDTQNTIDPDDDTITAHYDINSTPALEDDTVNHTFLENGLLYVSVGGRWSGSLTVINTQGTPDSSDDTIAALYDGSSTPSLQSDIVKHSFLQNNLLYISTLVEQEGSLYVIDTQGTMSQSDDILVMHYYTGSEPALKSNDVNHTFLANDLLYVSTSNGYGGQDGGLSVIDTQGTTDPSDDILVMLYDTNSTPALLSNDVYYSFLDNNLLYISTEGGLSVINTEGTTDPSDDTIAAHYDTNSTPALDSESVRHAFIDNNLLYISTDSETPQSLYVIDTKGTVDQSDDLLVMHYHTGSSPGIPSNRVRHSFLDNNILYVSTDYGLSFINLDDNNTYYVSSGTYVSLPQPLNTTPTTSLNIDTSERGDGQDYSLSYRTGTSDAVWRDDFDTDDSYVGDYYDYGEDFQTVVASGSVLKVSDPTFVENGGTFWINAEGGDVLGDAFEVGSVVTVRLRLNSEVTNKLRVTVFTDDYEGASISTDYDSVENDWLILSLRADEAFSFIGFGGSYGGDGDEWGPNDSIEIDWIEIITPDSFGEWNAWSSDCTNADCPIDPDDLTDNSWIQYRLDLSTDNPLLTPKVLSVTYNGLYEATSTYTSTTETFDTTQSLLDFDTTDDLPTDTTITYEYSIDNATTWIPVTPGTTLNIPADNFTWRATLATTDPTVTPTITLVTLSSTDIATSGGSSGTSIAKRIAKLEAEGKLDEALTLKDKYNNPATSRTTLEIQYEIVLKAKEIVALLERLVRLREGNN